jgi:hypothetical protein
MGNIKTGAGWTPTPAQQVVLDLTNDQETNVRLVQDAIDAAVLSAAGGAAKVDDLDRELKDRKGLEAEVAGLRKEFEEAAAAKVADATKALEGERDALKAEVSALRGEVESMKAKSLSPEAAAAAVGLPADPGGGTPAAPAVPGTPNPDADPL